MKFAFQVLFCLTAIAASLLQVATEDASPVSGKSRRLILCDGFIGLLKCPANMLIQVDSAFFGRRNTQTCANINGRHNCDFGARAKQIAAAKCNNRQSCGITGGIFAPDPCFGNYKYLELSYSCRALPSAVACDGSSLKIQCPAGKFILIRDGFYGRISDDYCAHGPRANYACSLANAKQIIADRCNNRQSCDVSTLITDPCPGTLKYLTSAYECMDYQMQVACDGSTLSVQCPPNTLIRVISGFQGRNADEFCTEGPRHTYECSNKSAHQRIMDACHNKPSCSIPTHHFGDPCPNTFKFASVKYMCT